jgi:hypothetical protein
MNLRKFVLLVVAILALAIVADAQRTKSKSKSKSKAKTSASAASPTPAMPADPAMQPITPTPQSPEHKVEGEVPRITVEELKARLAKNAPVFVIDSRSQGSYDNSEMKIKGAVRIPMDEIEARLSEIPRNREIVVYCT